MTLNTTATRTAKTTKTTEAEQLLRDAAFVLRLTRRVKDDILSDAARPSRPVARTTDRTPAALGV
ncbi:MAG: hypothetical protein JWO38_2158 [Gemmataceae bacterium]|nr:hypothetical protein [Gemmataceae bacterium]